MGYYRELSFRDLLRVSARAARTTAVVMLIVATATAVGWFITIAQIPNQVTDLFRPLIDSPVLLLLAIILRCVWVSRRAKSPMSCFMAMGFAGMLMVQVLLNVGMCLYVTPVIGLTLPFISYGGSSTLTLFIAMGIVSGIKMRSLPSWLKDRSEL